MEAEIEGELGQKLGRGCLQPTEETGCKEDHGALYPSK